MHTLPQGTDITAGGIVGPVGYSAVYSAIFPTPPPGQAVDAQVSASGGLLARADPCIGLHDTDVVAVRDEVDKEGGRGGERDIPLPRGKGNSVF